jgi:hypothetical protein
MAKAAQSTALRQAFTKHLGETKVQVECEGGDGWGGWEITPREKEPTTPAGIIAANRHMR